MVTRQVFGMVTRQVVWDSRKTKEFFTGLRSRRKNNIPPAP